MEDLEGGKHGLEHRCTNWHAWGAGAPNSKCLNQLSTLFFPVNKRFKYKVVLEWIDLAIIAQVFFSNFAAPAVTSHLSFPSSLVLVATRRLQILPGPYSSHPCSEGKARRHLFF